MIAVPMLIAVSLFLGWVLFKLALNALPLFAGMAAAFAVLQITDSLVIALIAGLVVGLAVQAGGPIAFRQAPSATYRTALAVLFTAPAAIAAWHATQGITGLVMVPGIGRDVAALVAAFTVGGLAWRRLTDRVSSTR